MLQQAVICTIPVSIWFLNDYRIVEVPRPSRTCSISRRDFRPDEPFFSVLTGENNLFVRKDIAIEHWTGPPENFYGWWKSTVKHVAEQGAQRQVSGETLQGFFEQLIVQSNEPDTLYILTLLMLRRKLLRYEKEIIDEQGNKLLEVYSFHTNLTYQVPTAMPGQKRLEAIQQQLEMLSEGAA